MNVKNSRAVSFDLVLDKLQVVEEIEKLELAGHRLRPLGKEP
jgi:hypothetical protein